MTASSSSNRTRSAAKTPVMRQYFAIKEKYPGKIVFFRMGDFYEMFGEDAEEAAPLLGIALTTRAHGDQEKIPLAGVPHHSAERYLTRLLEAGKTVVLVEQTEDPKQTKGLVRREVVEVMTPGTTVLGDEETRTAEPRIVAAVQTGPHGQSGIAWLNLATGEFLVDEGSITAMADRLRLIAPREILVPESFVDTGNAESFGRNGESLESPTTAPDWHFDTAAAQRDLCETLSVATLDGFGLSGVDIAIGAAGAILRYLRDNHLDQLSHLRSLTQFADGDHMMLDASTVRNLELFSNLQSGGYQHTLLETIDFTHTSAGTRRLRNSLLRPFIQLDPIRRRHDAIAELVRNRELAAGLRQLTRQLPDLERLVGRLGLGKASPRQIVALRIGLQTARACANLLQDSATADHLRHFVTTLPDTTPLITKLDAALVDDAPPLATKGGVIKAGFSAELDGLNDGIAEARRYIAGLQESERARTGIASLKVGFNQVFGYYLEVTKANADSVPDHYLRKQTLVNAERYITPELKEKEELISAAEEKIFSLEARLFAELVEDVTDQIDELAVTADLCAELDCVAGLAELAASHGYTRPVMHNGTSITIDNGRHPVIERVLPAGAFVANDLAFSDDGASMHILTGPNMSGKSTYLRQLGLITLLAQIGSFVPADRAEIGLVDRVFTRVGALDNLARGQSTFLVEMVETANILHHATDRSLVLLDEVGRGTSTFDGLSVAWAVAEALTDEVRARTVFATHYHELTALAELSPRVANFQVAVKRWQDEVIFLHQIIPGGCDDSYGIDVARLAGVPRGVIQRARGILRQLETGRFAKSDFGRELLKAKLQPSLFDPGQQTSEFEDRIRDLDLDDLSPMAAFDILRRWQLELREES